MTQPVLQLTRAQVLAHRRRASQLDVRLPRGRASLERAAWAGLQDSMPRAALLSIHARVEGTQPDAWEDPAFVQLWGPRYNAYVVAARDRAIFSLGRLPDSSAKRQFAQDHADRIEAVLEGRRLPYGEVGRLLGHHARALAYAAPTGRVLIRWDGARNPTVWTVPRPEMEESAARLELARRYLHVFGPTTADSFAKWAGIHPPIGQSAFESLAAELTPVRTPLGDAWILTTDEAGLRADRSPAAPCRLLPGGDAYTLLWGADRELLVPEAAQRGLLWTSRVWPGALLVGGEIIGTWRRDQGRITIETWRRLSSAERQAVEEEAQSLPLRGLAGQISVRWAD
ncbi:MAG TPA: crosslink repair DNA glycosylase YcaQ family protein [Candidatus Limnocylindria bacterium]|nr:crosslink repair DNA glycosylase YcaQ family protein [Candidatus Limnocylindria bacterium]